MEVRRVVRWLVLDKDDTFYRSDYDGTLDVLGKIEQLIGLDTSRIPMEQVDIKIFSRSVPVGIFLGYHLGLEGLLSLKVVPRRVGHGERPNLNEDQYALVFGDETMVFRREDRVASMVLAGFRQYANVIRNYAVHGFDRKDVYFNLMES